MVVSGWRCAALVVRERILHLVQFLYVTAYQIHLPAFQPLKPPVKAHERVENHIKKWFKLPGERDSAAKQAKRGEVG
jgi:hypothetical protein